MLKEPISESLVCLCALGLANSDATLAAAALTELLKQGSASGSAIEQRCLLTCTLLAVQGNFSAVPREVSRAVHRYFPLMKFALMISLPLLQKTNDFAGMYSFTLYAFYSTL